MNVEAGKEDTRAALVAVTVAAFLSLLIVAVLLFQNLHRVSQLERRMDALEARTGGVGQAKSRLPNAGERVASALPKTDDTKDGFPPLLPVGGNEIWRRFP